MLYTSYYNRISRTKPKGVYVQISNTKPTWFKEDIQDLSMLAPRMSDVRLFRNGEISAEELHVRWSVVFESVNKERLIKLIRELEKGHGDVFFLCYENSKPETVCHRHWFAEEMNECGLLVEEWNGKL